MKHNKNLGLLFTPSWVVNVIGVLLAVLVTAGVIVLNQFQGSELRREIFAVQAGHDTSASSVSTITDNISSNNFLNALPLLLVWAAVGLVVYYFAMAIVRSLGQAAELREQLGYVHVSRQARMREALMTLGIRAGAVIGWFICIKLSMSYLIPYALAAANAAATSFSVQNIGYALLSAVVIYFVIYINTVFVRLIALKPRLFGT